MPKFTVIVTRDITESCTVEVYANNATAAKRKAMEKLSADDNPKWEVDDDSCGSSAPYVTDCSEA